MRRIAILDAPSNLGLRPPTATSVPGCAKAPGALRDHGLITRLHARDAGCLTPPRYDPGDWRPGDGVCHAAEIATYSQRLADRIGGIIDAGEFPVVLGGDCSIVLGSALAMNRLGEAVGGRIGLVFVDGHSDFRHPGNASYVGAAAGEDLALVTGRGQADLAAIERRRPYYRDIDVVVMGIRAQDEYRLDLQAAGIVTRPVPTLRAEGAARSAQWAREQLMDCAGYWVHLDVDVLDPAVMPAVDAPSPGGIAFPELELLLAGLVDTPHCLGVEITVFDPDYDPDGVHAEEITSALVAGLAPVRTVAPRPDLVAARRESDDDADPVRERRAAAARDSVPLAAAGMSGGGNLPGTPGEAAAPAVTMLGVRPGEEVPAAPEEDRPALGSDRPAAGEVFGLDGDGEAGGELVPVTGSELVVAEAAPDVEPDPAAEAEVIVVEAVLGSGVDAGPAPDTEVVVADAVLDVDTDLDVDADLDAAAELDAEIDPGAGTDLGPETPADLDAGPEPRPDLPADLIAEAVPDVHPAEADAEADPDAAAEWSGDDVDPLTAEPAAPDPEEANGEQPRPGILPRPLGSAPLLDSEPLPATRPGMLRPRPAPVEGFSLPVQRPAFDIGPEEPADIS
jgi:arginase